MRTPLVTVAVVPRERFSFAERSLASVLDRTEGQFEVVYVDGNSPAPVQRKLELKAARYDFQLIRRDRYLSPNVARNLAASQVRTKYVVFIDNDDLVAPGWLERLVDCAEESGAWAVGPLYCQGEPEGTEIHMAGGKAHFYESKGRRFFHEQHLLCGRPVAKHGSSLQRRPVELLEFHCLLMRMDAFDRFGPLDEGYLSVHEHVDLCLTLRQAGLDVWMEPESVVTYVGPLPLTDDDFPFFSLRWSEAWNQLSVDHFQLKWDIDPADPGLVAVLHWAAGHRAKAQQFWRHLLRPLGRRRALRLIAAIDSRWNRRRYDPALCQPGGALDGARGSEHPPLPQTVVSEERQAA
jgi:glycosyltransferase involved in cell wall biosynthesis